MKVRHLIQILSLATFISGCESQFAFQEILNSCEPPKSSARYGKNQGPVIVSPDALQPFSSNLKVSGTCVDGEPLTFKGRGLASQIDTVCIDGTFNETVTFTNGDGSKELDVTQPTFKADKTEDILDRRCFLKDTIPPKVAITAGNSAVAYNTTTITVAGTCENRLEVYIDGPFLVHPVVTSCSGGKFSTPITLTGGDGLKDVIASQVDRAGNSGQDDQAYLADLIAPIVTIDSPNPLTLTNSSITITGICELGPPVVVEGSTKNKILTATCSALGQYSLTVDLSAGDGLKNIRASQTDLAGNIGKVDRDFMKDDTKPVVVITGPAADTITTGSLTLVGTCESGLAVNLSGDLTAADSTLCIAGAFSKDINLSGADGIKNIVATQTDIAGNSGSYSRDFNLDKSAPLVKIQSPAADSYWSSTSKLSGSCEIGLPVVLSGAGLTTSVSTICSGGSFSTKLTMTPGDGVKNIIATQIDASGNSGQDSRNFNVDTQAPAITITGPAAGTIAKNGVTLFGTCESGLSVSLSGSGLSAASSVNCSGSAFSAAITFSNGDGTKNIIASQTDSIGNSSTDNRNFVKDTTAPNIKITSPAVGASTAGSLVLSGNCETGLIVSISGDLSNPGTTPCGSGVFSTTIHLSGATGSKNIVASQIDSVGNMGSDKRNFSLVAASGYDSFISKGPGGKVDILFVDDNSASMEAEQAALGSKFGSFAAALSSVDWQAGIVTTDCTTGSAYNFCGQLHDLTGRPPGEYILSATTPDFLNVFKNSIQRPETIDCLLTASCPSGREESFKSAITAMDLRSADNLNFFRSDSDLALVFLTDEDESSNAPPSATTPTQVLSKFNSIWGTTKKISAYSIIVKPGDDACLNSQKLQLGANANYGTYFDALSNLTAGISVSICEPDYSVTMTQIGDDVTRLSKSVDLSNTPTPGSVSIVFTPAYSTRWTLTGNRVTFDTPAPFGTKVEIFYQY